MGFSGLMVEVAPTPAGFGAAGLFGSSPDKARGFFARS